MNTVAIGMQFDQDLLCCSCAEGVFKISEYPDLLRMTTEPVSVSASSLCECGQVYGDPRSVEAAGRILNIGNNNET